MEQIASTKVGGVFHIEHVRNGEVIDSWEDPNLITNEGLDHILDVVLHNDTQTATWYVALFEGNYTPLATDTGATISSNSTESTAYDEAARQEYVEAAASSQSITNSANKATFTINATKTIYGAFLTSESVKGGASDDASDICLAATRFSTSRSVVSGDQLLITYTISAASA